MGVLTKNELMKYMRASRKIENRLIITPLLDYNESIDPVAIDLRLGNEFIVMRKQAFPILDISIGKDLVSNIVKYQEKIRLNFRERFVLHPNQLIIGSTLEYISLPKNLMCYVIGKSTWGRMGLIIATATKIDPGYKGCITLEIINEGEAPVVLYPGIPISQLVFHETSGKAEYSGIYRYSTGPQFPDFSNKDKIWKFWFPKKETKTD